jgi:hypothetical protein
MNEETTTAAAEQIRPGIYTVVYPCGTHRTLRIKPWEKRDGTTSIVVGFLSGPDNEKSYTFCGFLRTDNSVAFFRPFQGQSPEWRARFRKAVLTVAADPKAAGLAYALESGRCCRCNRTLTVPASINAGMGPECASRE